MDITVTLLSGERTTIEVTPDGSVRTLYQTLSDLTTSGSSSPPDSTTLRDGVLTLADGTELDDMDAPLSGIGLEMGGELVMRAGKRYEALQALKDLGVRGRDAKLERRLRAEVSAGASSVQMAEKRIEIITHILAVGVVPGEDVFQECIRRGKVDVAKVLFAAGPVPQTGLFSTFTEGMHHPGHVGCLDLIFAHSTEAPTEALLIHFIDANDLNSCRKILDAGVIPRACMKSNLKTSMCKLLCGYLTQEGRDEFLLLQMTCNSGWQTIPTLLEEGAKVKGCLSNMLKYVWSESQILSGRTPAMWSGLFEAGLDGTNALRALLLRVYFSVLKDVLKAGLKPDVDMIPLAFTRQFWKRATEGPQNCWDKRVDAIREVLRLVIEAGAELNCVVHGATVLDGAKNDPVFARFLREEGAVTAKELELKMSQGEAV